MEIDLRAFAKSEGYALDRPEIWRGSSVMRSKSGDKIVVKRDADNHYLYFSVRNDHDNGSIIDLVVRRKSLKTLVGAAGLEPATSCV